ncbi:RsmB/NOP family class I SAM-dependent RNA methyltransferase [Caulobacter sp. NIBR1757]|uniref:RsmB/NOP family class I SAM-dependent RNA methyltransferase n=1 Tax=Caulobacter sp. NIBR1757 TaxID=3016000 RepID=UPI0022F10469|nr:RsmB/NOP family class I SAM-dependent RNA methyltransferase [Caulobacter sp. NIBR1757]WGM39922.1 Ribosomal RNA small subunit methyltransferase B [Caulobacter sp. NIBR1757]
MRDGGRIAAAIQVLDDIELRHKPVRQALKTWSDGARYAGSKDRAWVSGLALDVLRRQRSLAHLMGEESNRARALAALRWIWDWDMDRLGEACADPHGPGPLTDHEIATLNAKPSLKGAKADVQGDYPDWIEASMARTFGKDRVEEGIAFAQRAPVDLRVNRLKSDAYEVLKALDDMGAEPAGILPDALRVPAPAAAERAAAVEIHPSFAMGWFEVQDLGSQMAAAVAGDVAGQRVLDYCAGGGGKTLALAAAMGNSGKIYAYDSDARRMTDIIPRATRAGVTNLELRTPLNKEPLNGLQGEMDLVFVDAPCTGSGTWRRHPDAKWRLTPDTLQRRLNEQRKVLDQASEFVRPGGRMVYVTCSFFAEENEQQVEAFLARNDAFKLRKLTLFPDFTTPQGYLRLSPRTAGTDGFFAALLDRKK